MSEERQYLRFGGKSWHVSINKEFWCDPALTIEARSLWLTLYFFVSPTSQNPFPSYLKLAQILGWHRNTLRRYLKELEEHHYLSRWKERFEVTIYTLYCDPKEWQPSQPLKLVRDDEGRTRVETDVTDRDQEAAQNFTHHAQNLGVDTTKNCARITHKICARQEPISTPQSPEDEPTPSDPLPPKSFPVLKNNHIEEEAAAPLSPDFVSEKTPEQAGRQLKPGEVAREDTVEFMVMEVAKNYPRLYMKVTGRRNLLMSQASREAATEFFQDTEDWSVLDVIYVGLKGFQESKVNPYPGKGNDPYWACRRFTTPNQLFALSPDNEYRLIRMALELNYVPGDISHEEVYRMIQDLIRASRQKE